MNRWPPQGGYKLTLLHHVRGHDLVVAMMIAPEYIHPRKFGVKVALQFGLICDVCSSEEEALAWLAATAGHAAHSGK